MVYEDFSKRLQVQTCKENSRRSSSSRTQTSHTFSLFTTCVLLLFLITFVRSFLQPHFEQK